MFTLTKCIEEREKQWQEEWNKQRTDDQGSRSHSDSVASSNRRHKDDDDIDKDDNDNATQGLLDQNSSVPAGGPRSLSNSHPTGAIAAATGLPVPDIKLEPVDIESSNYSTNV
jgi:hypothetical protein